MGICFCFVETNLCACRFGVRGREFKGEKDFLLAALCFTFSRHKKGEKDLLSAAGVVAIFCLLYCFVFLLLSLGLVCILCAAGNFCAGLCHLCNVLQGQMQALP